MRFISVLLLLGTCASAQTMPSQDAVRVAEFYRLASQIQDKVWPDWKKTASPLLLVTPGTEFLTHHPAPPKEFTRVADDVYARPRQFPAHLLATFPAFGPPSVIVIGQAQNTDAKTSTPWLIVVMHEHFHQLQNSQPGYYDAINNLGLSGGDTSGMWMLNYPFPYDKPEVAAGFARLRDLLLNALAENDKKNFKKLAKQYASERAKWFASLSPNDHKYFSFQVWQEGIARYTQVKAAEAAADYQPTPEYASLSDYQSFTTIALNARGETLDELKRVDLAKSKRTSVYSFGAAEGMLLDRMNPGWKSEYFKHPFSTDAFFVVK
ncbi:MAG: hypothetical protein JWO13_3529 [Acidobacteriales bacterium]|nr:hypothetical protein [Terriglobales bacterium]